MPWLRCFGSNRLAWMALRLTALKAETKTMKAMKTPAAEENMKARRASAAKVDASQITLIRIEDPANACEFHLTSPCLTARSFDVCSRNTGRDYTRLRYTDMRL